MFILGAANIISFILMNLKLPYACSMDFRYIVPIIFVQAIFISYELQDIIRKNNKKGEIIFISVFEITIMLMFFSDIMILLA